MGLPVERIAGRVPFQDLVRCSTATSSGFGGLLCSCTSSLGDATHSTKFKKAYVLFKIALSDATGPELFGSAHAAKSASSVGIVATKTIPSSGSLTTNRKGDRFFRWFGVDTRIRASVRLAGDPIERSLPLSWLQFVVMIGRWTTPSVGTFRRGFR